MASIRVKYKYGQKVNYDGIPGRVTAIFCRGRNRAYEFGYVDKDGNPVKTCVEECEIQAIEPDRIGFKA